MPTPKHIISLGAGVQSSTMALMAKHGEITPMPDAAIFADTQDEPRAVYEWLDWLEPKLPFPVHRVTKGVLSEAALRVRTSKLGNKYTKSAPPAFLLMPERKTGEVYLWGEEIVDPETIGIMQRQCTGDFKIRVINAEVRRLRKAAKIGKIYPRITQWIGISTEEAHRMKPSQVPYIDNVWPLIDKGISRADCILWMLAQGYPRPPRSSCKYCPFHSDAEWINLKENHSQDFQEAVLFDHNYRETMKEVTRGVPYLHRSCVPLDQVEFKQGDTASQFGNECAGVCGV